MSSPLDDYPPAWIAEADQECADTVNWIRRLVAVHRLDIERLKARKLEGQMSSIGILAVTLLDDSCPHATLSRTTLGYLLAAALDMLARTPDAVDPLESITL